MKRILFLFLVAGFLSNCTPKADLGDFDTETWKSDVKGCSGERAQMIDELQEVKRNLLGLYQKTIIKALGQPEEQELYKRSMNYYIYFIDPATDCENGVEEPRYLEVRFTSLGIANEVNIK